MQNVSDFYDVIVIGGGPAGSTMGSFLAKARKTCLVLEAEKFPRPHVGESLVPSSNRVFEELGVMDKIRQANFPKKFGAVWTSAAKAPVYDHDWHGLKFTTEVDVEFNERKMENIGHEYTFHVDRAKFDKILLDHAESLGATVLEEARVSKVEFSKDEQIVHFEHEGRSKYCVARIVVDASGRKTMLASQLKTKQMDPVFNQVAMHCWFDDFDRKVLSSKDRHEDHIFIHFLPISNTWVWQIPITDTITSVGVVSQSSYFRQFIKRKEDFFWESIGKRPELYDALQKAKQVTELKTEGDYSYSMTEIVGDGYVLVGDAGRFVDPIFSSGVSIALNGARFASTDVIAALDRKDFSKASFATYEKTIRKGGENWHAFISLYYRLNVIFTAFLRDERYRLGILKLLQGDVYDDEKNSVIAAMSDAIKEVEADKSHPWYPYLGTMFAQQAE